MRKFLAAAAGFALAAGIAAQAQAQTDDFKPKAQGTWVLDARVTDVAPSGKDAIVTAAGAATGLDAKVSDDVMPTVGIGYFLTDHIALELVLGTTHHDATATGTGVDAKVRETWVLPPILAAQYHFMPKARFSPYVGAGPNLMLFYGGSNKNGYDVKLKNGVGFAAEAGFDYAVKGHWTLNVDVKKVWFETDATINGGALRSKIHLDPWVPSVGIGYRF